MQKVNNINVELGGMGLSSYSQEMINIADECMYFERIENSSNVRSCLNCEFIDNRIFICKKLGKTVIEYSWN